MVTWFLSTFYYPHEEFDRKKWQVNKEERYEMSQDIVESKILIGKTKQQVRELLGDESNKDEEDVWMYYLGFVQGIGIDPDILEIEFKAGKVIKVVQRET